MEHCAIIKTKTGETYFYNRYNIEAYATLADDYLNQRGMLVGLARNLRDMRKNIEDLFMVRFNDIQDIQFVGVRVSPGPTGFVAQKDTRYTLVPEHYAILHLNDGRAIYHARRSPDEYIELASNFISKPPVLHYTGYSSIEDMLTARYTAFTLDYNDVSRVEYHGVSVYYDSTIGGLAARLM